MFQKFGQADFYAICDLLGRQDNDLKNIVDKYNYPPFWSRPNTFESIVHIILEQQVSLASALSALKKLTEKIKSITAAKVMLLSDAELKECYFSRQKITYVRTLAGSIISGQLSLETLALLDAGNIRKQLTSVKGIGNWTVDIYLIFILHHADVFPAGDLAAVNAIKNVKNLSISTTKEEILAVADSWRPYRTIATMLLWHYYLEERKPGKKIF